MAVFLSLLPAWLLRAVLPADPLPRPDAARERATDDALVAAREARRELEELKRRARAVGIDVDVTRGWGPRGEP